MDLNTPELTKIFREEVDERSRRLITGARALSAGELAADSVADLVRDAHTIKGSAGLLGYELIRDAAALLNVSEKTVYRWIEQGELPAYRVDDQYRINRAELLEWATSRKLHVSPEIFAETNSL